MLEKGNVYSRDEWDKEVSDVVFGVAKDILKDRFAPQIEYADFFMGLSKSGKLVYCAKMVADDSMIGKMFAKKKIKILGVLSKVEYDLV